jgi:leucyl aminopeptidase
MDITLAGGSAEKLRTGVLVLGAFAGGGLPRGTDAADRLTKGRLSALVLGGELGATAGSVLMLYGLQGVMAERVLLVSLGKADAFGEAAYRKALEGAAKALAGSVSHDAVFTLADIDVPHRTLLWRLETVCRTLAESSYRFVLPTTPKPVGGRGVRSVMVVIPETLTSDMTTAHRRGLAVAEGVALAKDLGNMPGNICDPAYLADTCSALAGEFGFSVEILERADMEALGMGSFLAVGRASHAPCKMAVMHYRGGKTAGRPIVLVGKGITFDTGGVSLKPGANLDEMKFDMSGAGSVIGVMRTVARLGLPINVVGIVAAAENMPGGDAARPGDVVTSMSGQTIEILNTDAEGRLVLCDALTYAERFEPECVIDVATLTGACVVALGRHASGLFANDDTLAAELMRSGADSGDRAWMLPMWDDYLDQLHSNFADTSNLGGPAAGAVTAACFLGRFTKNYRWAHLDIAGTASMGGPAKGSTGRPVPLLADFLVKRAAEGS